MNNKFKFRMWKQHMLDNKKLTVADIKELDDIVQNLSWDAVTDSEMNQSE